jgi:hypothetical protein
MYVCMLPAFMRRCVYLVCTYAVCVVYVCCVRGACIWYVCIMYDSVLRSCACLCLSVCLSVCPRGDGSCVGGGWADLSVEIEVSPPKKGRLSETNVHEPLANTAVPGASTILSLSRARTLSLSLSRSLAPSLSRSLALLLSLCVMSQRARRSPRV